MMKGTKMKFKPMPSYVCLFGVRAKCVLMECILCMKPAFWAQFQFAACYPSSLMECLLRVTMLNRWLVSHQHQMDRRHHNNNNHKSNNFINTFSSSRRLSRTTTVPCRLISSRSSISNRISNPNRGRGSFFWHTFI